MTAIFVRGYLPAGIDKSGSGLTRWKMAIRRALEHGADVGWFPVDLELQDHDFPSVGPARAQVLFERFRDAFEAYLPPVVLGSRVGTLPIVDLLSAAERDILQKHGIDVIFKVAEVEGMGTRAIVKTKARRRFLSHEIEEIMKDLKNASRSMVW